LAETNKYEYVCLNTDGASKGNQTIDNCGGLIRGARGNQLRVFPKNLGWCNVCVVELWEVLESLRLAWDRDYSRAISCRFYCCCQYFNE
jgi:ribonuclease HI